MAKLTLNDLKKPQKNSKKPRIAVLKHKIQHGEQFKLASGQSKTLQYASENIKTLFEQDNFTQLQSIQRTTPYFIDNNKKPVKLSDLEKTAEFGSSSGSGAGAGATNLNESAQCLYASLAFRVLHRKIKPTETITHKQLEAAWKYCKCSISLDKILHGLSEEWIQSSITGANLLYTHYKGKSYTFHRGSKEMDTLGQLFLSLRVPEINNINKWNPADIYMIEDSSWTRNLNSFRGARTLLRLNSLLATALKKKQVVPISLKKMSAVGHMAEINTAKDREQVKKYRLIDYRITSRRTNASIFDSKDMIMVYGTGGRDDIQFRTFTNDLGSFMGELDGFKAKQGKIGHGALNDILKRFKCVPLPEQNNIKSMVANDQKAVLSRIYDLAKTYRANGLQKYKSKKSFMDDAWEQSREWRYSKYYCLLLLDTIMAKSQRTQNEILRSVWLYASSRTKLSATYIKLA